MDLLLYEASNAVFRPCFILLKHAKLWFHGKNKSSSLPVGVVETIRYTNHTDVYVFKQYKDISLDKIFIRMYNIDNRHAPQINEAKHCVQSTRDSVHAGMLDALPDRLPRGTE